MRSPSPRIFPALQVYPVCADFLRSFPLPEQAQAARQRLGLLFPGSTIGNMTGDERLTLPAPYRAADSTAAGCWWASI